MTTVTCTFQEFKQMAAEFRKMAKTANLEELENGWKCLGLAYLGMNEPMWVQSAVIALNIMSGVYLERRTQLGLDSDSVSVQWRRTVAANMIHDMYQKNHVATVAEDDLSRYTLEFTNGPLPEGTKLYTFDEVDSAKESYLLETELDHALKPESPPEPSLPENPTMDVSKAPMSHKAGDHVYVAEDPKKKGKCDGCVAEDDMGLCLKLPPCHRQRRPDNRDVIWVRVSPLLYPDPLPSNTSGENL